MKIPDQREESKGVRRAEWRGLNLRSWNQKRMLLVILGPIVFGALSVALSTAFKGAGAFTGMTGVIGWLLFSVLSQRWSKRGITDLGTHREGVEELYGFATFEHEGVTYAEDEGLVVLEEGFLTFDGRQTTFSVPLHRSRASVKSLLLTVRMTDSKFIATFQLSGKETAFVNELDQRVKDAINFKLDYSPEEDMMFPTEPEPRFLRPRPVGIIFTLLIYATVIAFAAFRGVSGAGWVVLGALGLISGFIGWCVYSADKARQLKVQSVHAAAADWFSSRERGKPSISSGLTTTIIEEEIQQSH